MQRTKIANRTRLGPAPYGAGNRSRAGFTRLSCAGLTLIEMMVAIGAACIVLLAMAIILVFGQRSWNRTLQQANLQRDASYAMLKMGRELRAGAKAQLEDSGRVVRITDSNDVWTLFRFVPGQNQLRYQLEGEDEQTLLDDVVEGVTFVVDPNTGMTVTVDLELQDGTCETRMKSTTLMRNHAGM